MENLLLNIIPFTALPEQEFAFYTKREESFCPLFKDDVKGLIDDLVIESEEEDGPCLYTDFKPAREGATVINVDLTESTRFAAHYYRHLIRQYFIGVADVWRNNFTNEVEVWLLDKRRKDQEYNLYHQFTLKVQHCRVTTGPELVVSYDGTTKVYKKSLAEIKNFPTELYNWINCDGELHRWKYFPEQYKLKRDKCFPVLSNTMKPHLGIAFDSPDFSNRYPKYLELLQGFYSKFLNTENFKKIIPISSKGFLKADDSIVSHISNTSNELLFGEGNIGTDPSTDFKKYGPCKPIASPKNVKFFFIYHKPDRELAPKYLYDYFLNGYPGRWRFPKMDDFIHQPFEIEDKGSISYDSLDEAVKVVEKAIRNKDKLPNTQYCAIYFNPIPKIDKDPERNRIYYLIKEILLNSGITSQVIRTESICVNGQPNSWFNAYLPHIEVAILAKLGGIPWRLNRPSTNELIVGIGAFYSMSRKTKFVGSAFCFDNEGGFKGFDCFGANDTVMLAGSIREAVGKFIASNYKATRLIIHFYKDIGKRELQPIIDTLNALGLPIPVIIVTINKTESKELLAFDLSSPKKYMPYSGTYVKVGWREYLLFNNTRYNETSEPKQKEYHFPIKISFSSSKPELLDDAATIEQLIDQVYQFSRMYWKTTSQQSLPVTIKYPEMVAQIYPYFKYDKLPEFGKENLWFL